MKRIKQIQFIPKRAQGIIMLIYLGIACILTNVLATVGVYLLINPLTTKGKATTVIICTIIFLLICGFLGGAFSKDAENEEDEN